MSTPFLVLGESLMDCIAQPDGSLMPFQGGSPFNMARAAALQGARPAYINPFSTDLFGSQLKGALLRDGGATLMPDSRKPTSLAVVTLTNGQPSYGFYREGIADRDYSVEQALALLEARAPGLLHTGSLMLVPPEHQKVLAVLRGAKARGWTISVDVNLRPRLAADLDEYCRAVREIMTLADWLKASDEDLETLGWAPATWAGAEALVAPLKALGPSRLALTFGGEGALLHVDGQQVKARAPAVAVADTVGAGDTFWGTCLADWTREAPTPAAERTLQRALKAAAINCTRKGCQPPTLAELEA